MKELNFKEVLNSIWKNKLLIILAVLVFGLLGNVYVNFFVTPSYEVSTTFILATIQETNASEQIGQASISEKDLNINETLLSTYRELINSDNVLDKVIKNLNLNMTAKQLKKCITVSAVEDTELLEIRVRMPYKTTIIPVTKEIVDVFSEKVKEIYKIDNIYVIDEPKTPTQPYNMNKYMYILGFSFVAFCISVGGIVISNFFDTTIKNEKDVEELGLTLLSKIPKYKRQSCESEIVLLENPTNNVSEALRILRTNLQYSETKHIKKFMITSCNPGDGKSWLATNFAISLAQIGKRVVLIDADLRKGRQSDIFSVTPYPGLAEYLLNPNKIKITQCLRKTINPNLLLIPTGTVDTNLTEILNLEMLQKLVSYLETKTDVIVFDTPPCLLVSESLIVSKVVDSTILVATQNNTKISEIKKAQNNLKRVGGNLTGMVLNKSSAKLKSYSYYYGKQKKKETKNIKLLYEAGKKLHDHNVLDKKNVKLN